MMRLLGNQFRRGPAPGPAEQLTGKPRATSVTTVAESSSAAESGQSDMDACRRVSPKPAATRGRRPTLCNCTPGLHPFGSGRVPATLVRWHVGWVEPRQVHQAHNHGGTHFARRTLRPYFPATLTSADTAALVAAAALAGAALEIRALYCSAETAPRFTIRILPSQPTNTSQGSASMANCCTSSGFLSESTLIATQRELISLRTSFVLR